MDAIDELGLGKNTLVMFTSDNGPWNNMKARLRRKHNGAVAWGSSGSLREGKGSTYEGGLRVPCIVRWPGRVPAGRQSDAIFATIEDRVLTTPATGTRNSQPGVAGLREKPEAVARTGFSRTQLRGPGILNQA